MRKRAPASKIKVLLVDDHPLVREGIRACLAKHKKVTVVGEAADGLEAISKAAALSPDIVLLDISMPKMNGVEVTKILRKKHPAVKILLLTMHENRTYIVQAARTGANGYVLKDAPPRELLHALEAVHRGETYFSNSATQVIVSDYTKGETASTSSRQALTQRETEVLKLISEGLSNKEIASQIQVSVRTVETHRERVMRKLNIHSAPGLTKYALSIGLTNIS